MQQQHLNGRNKAVPQLKRQNGAPPIAIETASYQFYSVMADPLSISASVAGVVSFIGSVTQSCYGIYREVKNAPRMLKDVIDELALLEKVLVDLKAICDQCHEPLDALTNIAKDLQTCRARLRDFDKQLSAKFQNPRSILSRFRWSLEGSEIKSFVN